MTFNFALPHQAIVNIPTPVISVLAIGIAAIPACGPSRSYDDLSGRTIYLESLGQPAGSRSRSSGPRDSVSYWDGSAASGSPSILIDLGQQRAKFFKGGTLVGISQISSGREGFNTPTGNFKITQKNANHRSNLYGVWKTSDGTVINDDVDVRKSPNPPPGARYEGASMPYFMRINGGVGMHAGYLPGFPDSHGCIRMPENMAQHFFHNVSNGTPVSVTY